MIAKYGPRAQAYLIAANTLEMTGGFIFLLFVKMHYQLPGQTLNREDVEALFMTAIDLAIIGVALYIYAAICAAWMICQSRRRASSAHRSRQ